MGRHRITTTAGNRRQWTRRVVAGAAAAGAITALALVVPTAARAAGTAPSSTTVKAVPSPAGLQANVALVASVKILNLPGAGVLPTGSVTFTADTVGFLGQAKLDTCILKTCKATLNTTALPLGTNVITASWPGDSVGAPSHGSTSLVINETSYQTNSSVACDKFQNFCDTGLVESTDGGTFSDLFTEDPPGTKHPLSLKLTNGTLKCGDANAGELDSFSDSPDVQGIFKTLRDTATDPVEADNVRAAYFSHPGYLGCFAAHTPFISGVTGKTAPLVLEGTQFWYEAPLPSCGEGTSAPCFRFFDGQDQYGNYPEADVLTVEVDWQQGISDPKYIK